MPAPTCGRARTATSYLRDPPAPKTPPPPATKPRTPPRRGYRHARTRTGGPGPAPGPRKTRRGAATDPDQQRTPAATRRASGHGAGYGEPAQDGKPGLDELGRRRSPPCPPHRVSRLRPPGGLRTSTSDWTRRPSHLNHRRRRSAGLLLGGGLLRGLLGRRFFAADFLADFLAGFFSVEPSSSSASSPRAVLAASTERWSAASRSTTSPEDFVEVGGLLDLAALDLGLHQRLDGLGVVVLELARRRSRRPGSRPACWPS